MNNLLLLSFLFTANSLFSQSISFDTIQRVPNGEYNEYLASDKYQYKIGDTIELAKPSSGETYSFIVRFFNNNIGSLKKATSTYNGYKTVISKIKVVNSKCIIDADTKNSAGVMTFSIQFDEALNGGEIKPKGMTSSKALNELKLAKEKLDLGLITQEEYEKIKVELAKFIK
jgi:hypothetical protein